MFDVRDEPLNSETERPARVAVTSMTSLIRIGSDVGGVERSNLVTASTPMVASPSCAKSDAVALSRVTVPSISRTEPTAWLAR